MPKNKNAILLSSDSEDLNDSNSGDEVVTVNEVKKQQIEDEDNELFDSDESENNEVSDHDDYQSEDEEDKQASSRYKLRTRSPRKENERTRVTRSATKRETRSSKGSKEKNSKMEVELAKETRSTRGKTAAVKNNNSVTIKKEKQISKKAQTTRTKVADRVIKIEEITSSSSDEEKQTKKNKKKDEDDDDDDDDDDEDKDDDDDDDENAENEGDDVITDEQHLKEIRKKQLKHLNEMRRQQNASISRDKELTKQERLAFLLKQTEIFRHFIHGKSSSESLTDSPSTKREKKYSSKEDAALFSSHEVHTRLTVSPSFIKGTLREYQIDGLNWLINLYDHGINGILADEMGLGKTLQTISLLGYLKNIRKVSGPHLVIAPKSTLANWENEFHRWCPSLQVIKFIGDKVVRGQIKSKIQPGKFDVVVTSYEIACIEKSKLKGFNWRYLVIDEAHRIKNEQSLLSKVVRYFSSNYRLLITGTPLQNNLHELWALLNFLLPEVFQSAEDFDNWFSMDDTNKEEVTKKLHKVLGPFLLRRLKSEVEHSLPPKKETKLFVKLTPMQRQWYINIITKNLDAINGGRESRMRLLNILMQLRKCCNHPYLFEGAEPGPPYSTGDHLIDNAAKMKVLDLLLNKLHQKGSRVLIFSQMTRMLDIMEDYLEYRGYKYCRIDGQTNGDERDQAIENFNAPDSPIFVFLLSTRAGGLGINLATADTVILYDSDWNPQVDLQAQDRAHRIGQKKQVNVYRLITEKTVEELIVERAEAKLYLDALVIQQGRLVDESKSMNKNEISNIIKFGADEIYKSEGDITEYDIEQILAKGQERTKEIAEKFQKSANGLGNFSLSVQDVNIYEYMGVNYKKDKINVHKIYENSGFREKRSAALKLSEDRSAREALALQRKLKPKVLKQPTIYDFQFYPQRLYDLLEKEKRFYDRQDSDRDEDLTKEEQDEKERLLKEEGFHNWNKRDYYALLRAFEICGVNDFVAIAAEIGTKTPDEVKDYSDIFWKKIKSLPDHEKIISNIERAQSRQNKKRDMMRCLSSKIAEYTQPWTELTFTYGQNKGKLFTTEEDQFLICMTNKVGYGNWEALKNEIRISRQFRFDWFLKSRNTIELQRRVDSLIRLIEKENEQKTENKASNGTKLTNSGFNYLKKSHESNNNNSNAKSKSKTSKEPPVKPPKLGGKRSPPQLSSMSKSNKVQKQ